MLLPGPTKGILVCTPPWVTKMETRVYVDGRWQNHWVDSIGRVSSMTTYGILPFHLRPPSLGQFVSEGGGNIYYRDTSIQEKVTPIKYIPSLSFPHQWSRFHFSFEIARHKTGKSGCFSDSWKCHAHFFSSFRFSSIWQDCPLTPIHLCLSPGQTHSPSEDLFLLWSCYCSQSLFENLTHLAFFYI